MSKINKEVLLDQIYRKSTDIGSKIGMLLSIGLIRILRIYFGLNIEDYFEIFLLISWNFDLIGWLAGFYKGCLDLTKEYFEKLKKN